MRKYLITLIVLVICLGAVQAMAATHMLFVATQNTATLEEYEADTSDGKTWGRAYIPMKWYGADYEHFE